MADASDTKPTGLAGIPRIRDQHFREIYANSTFSGLSPYDINITFSKATDIGGQIVQVDHALVTMSPQHFKALVRSLNVTLQAYENVFGELKIPDLDTAPAIPLAVIEGNIIKAQEAKRTAIATAISASSTEQKPPSKRSRGASRKSS